MEYAVNVNRGDDMIRTALSALKGFLGWNSGQPGAAPAGERAGAMEKDPFETRELSRNEQSWIEP